MIDELREQRLAFGHQTKCHPRYVQHKWNWIY